MNDPSPEPDYEACHLSAFAEHISHFMSENPRVDPHVMIKIDGKWHPVHAGIKATGEHRNAVAIEYLIRNDDGTYSEGYERPR